MIIPQGTGQGRSKLVKLVSLNKVQPIPGVDPEIIEGGGIYHSHAKRARKIFRSCPQNVCHTPLERHSLIQIVHGSNRTATENVHTANAQTANIWTKIPGK